MVHCSGGAQTKILHFLERGTCRIKDNLFPVPPLFKIDSRRERHGSWKEMYEVFNMGHRMELYVDAVNWRRRSSP